MRLELERISSFSCFPPSSRMTSVTRSEDQEPTMSETQDRPLQPSLKPLEALPQSSAYQEMMTQGVSEKKTTLARTLERGKVVVPTTRRDLS